MVSITRKPYPGQDDNLAAVLWMQMSRALGIIVRQGRMTAMGWEMPKTSMRAGILFWLFASALLCLGAGGCGKCGEPVKINLPTLPGACYESAPPN